MHSIYNGYGLLRVYPLQGDSTRACDIGCPRSRFSSNNIQLHSLSVSYTVQALLGLFFFMAVWCTNTSSLLSFLFMKPYPFRTVNHFTVPKTCVAMSFLSPLADTAMCAPPGHRSLQFRAWCWQRPGQGQLGSGGSCWVSASLLMLVVMVTGTCCGSGGPSKAVMVTRPRLQWGRSGLFGTHSPHLLLIELSNSLVPNHPAESSG